QISVVVSILLLTTIQPLAAESPSDAKRIEELERTVAELKKEVAELKKETGSVSEGKMKTKISYDGKTYVEKAVVEEAKTPIWVNWHQIPALQVKAGQYKAPFGLEQLTPDTSLLTIERTLPTGAITPDRQIGAELWGKPFTSIWPEQKDLLTYYAGIFNGNGRNITVNDNNNFMFVGRLELQPLKDVFGKGSFLKFGGDVLNSRDEQGVNISQSSNLLVNSDGSLSPFVLPSADERTAWSVDAWLRMGPFD